jgi:pentatricopeptide repeat protein
VLVLGTVEDLVAQVHALGAGRPSLAEVASIVRRLQSMHDQGRGTASWDAPFCLKHGPNQTSGRNARVCNTDVRVALDALMELLSQTGQCHPFLCSALIALLGKLQRTDVALELVTRMTQQGHVRLLALDRRCLRVLTPACTRSLIRPSPSGPRPACVDCAGERARQSRRGGQSAVLLQ